VRLLRVITGRNRDDLLPAVKHAPVGARLELIDEPRT
jgi:hypothetical protein